LPLPRVPQISAVLEVSDLGTVLSENSASKYPPKTDVSKYADLIIFKGTTNRYPMLLDHISPEFLQMLLCRNHDDCCPLLALVCNEDPMALKFSTLSSIFISFFWSLLRNAIACLSFHPRSRCRSNEGEASDTFLYHY
jgi:hypothetical protein